MNEFLKAIKYNAEAIIVGAVVALALIITKNPNCLWGLAILALVG